MSEVVEGRENHAMSAPRGWRGEIRVCFPAENVLEAGRIFEKFFAAAEDAGAFIEGGSCELMNADDVIPDSPLAVALARPGGSGAGQ